MPQHKFEKNWAYDLNRLISQGFLYPFALYEVLAILSAIGLSLRFIYSRLSLSRSQRDPLKYFELSVLRHIRCAELRKTPIERPNFTNEHVI